MIGFSAVALALSTGLTYYVAPAPVGSMAGNGSWEQPWSDIQHGLDALRAGDTLVLRDGIYRPTQRLEVRGSGQVGAWITIRGEDGAMPIIEAGRIRPKDIGEASGTGVITIRGPSYVRVEGLRIQNSHQAGIWVERPSTHIDILNCRIDRTFAPAIGCWNVEDLRVLRCEVTEANTNRMRLYGSRSREAPHEAISIAGCDRFEVAYCHVHHCEKEGIDVKEVSRNGTVHHNVVHDLRRQGLYADAWFGLLENVVFHHNVVSYSEWGLVIGVEGRASELRNVSAHHNIIFRNRASGIYLGTWGGDGPRSGITIYNNTLFGNGHADHWAGPTGNIDLRSRNTTDLVVANNICFGGGAFEIATAIPEDQWRSRNLVVRDNLVGSDRDRTQEGIDGYGRLTLMLGSPVFFGDPQFVDPQEGNFALQNGSPGLASGWVNGRLPAYQGGYLGAIAPKDVERGP
ncbi:MAG: right-handed parallel beta-helix repeat-containing protein [Fimbriimonadaceae bacterium]